MARSRFITPGVTRIPISDGDWIDVKSELSAGDQRRQDVLAMHPRIIEGKLMDVVDWSEYEILRAHLWLVDWSFIKLVNDKPTPVPITVDSIKSLDLETFEEINNLIFKHIMAVIAEKKTKKSLETKVSPNSSDVQISTS